jgi:hypothetical protein
MAVPRPVLLALLGLALCAAAFLATRGAQEPSGEITVAPTPAPAPAAPAQKPAQNKAEPAAKPKKSEAAPAPKPAEQNQARTEAERALEGAEMVARTSSGQPKPAPAERGTHQTAVDVTRALGKGDVVVFFFTHHGAADDQQTRQAVETLQDQKDVLVVKAGLEDLADYRPVLAGAGVSQVPSIVIVHADTPARLIEGYVDPGTLHQAVADALR